VQFNSASLPGPVPCDRNSVHVEMSLRIQVTVTNVLPVGRLLTVAHNQRRSYPGNYDGSMA